MGALLFSEERSKFRPLIARLGNGFVVAWRGNRPARTEFVEYREPWDKPAPSECPINGEIESFSSDSAGSRIALTSEDHVCIFDVASGRWSLVSEVAGDSPARPRDIFVTGISKHEVSVRKVSLGPQAHQATLSPSGRLVAHVSRGNTIVTEIGTNRQVIACHTRWGRRKAFHPSSDWLVVYSDPISLISLREEPHCRCVYVGGKSAEAAATTKVEMERLQSTDLQAFEQDARAKLERRIEWYRKKIQERSMTCDDPELLFRVIRGGEENRLARKKSLILAIKEGRFNPPHHPKERLSCVGFSRDGRWFWCGVKSGLQVFDWSALPREDEADWLEPKWSFDLPGRTPSQQNRWVYAIAEEFDAPAVVFGGVTERLYRLDLQTGETKELLRLPRECTINDLSMSADGKSLGVLTRERDLDGDPRNGPNHTWEIWSYPALRAAATE